MKNRQDSLLAVSTKLGEISDRIGAKNVLAAQRLLHVRILEPHSFVTLVGETSSGKSTIINGFLEKAVLPTAASPTTGAITQVVNELGIGSTEYYAINKDGTAEPINEQLFAALSVKPDKDLMRLQVRLKPKDAKYNNLNVFDTPGYNSLIAEHEEILRTFLPESDVIIYVVNQRTGFGMEDKYLVESIGEIIGSDNVEFLLVVNRCPESETIESKRTVEITNFVSDCYHSKVIPFLVYSTAEISEEDTLSIFPKADELWAKVAKTISNEDRFEKILDYSQTYLIQLLTEMKLDLEQRIQLSQLKKEELASVNETLLEFSESEEGMVNILSKYCARWERTLPKVFENELDVLIHSIDETIQKKNKWLEVGSCSAFIAEHHLPHGIRSISRVVENYQLSELEQMNKEMADLANQAIKKMVDSATAFPAGKVSEVIKILIAKLGIKMLGEVARGLIISLGGRGGMAAGMGNLAKMGLKRFGNIFGKGFRFGRGVYDNIGKFFNKEMLKKLNVIMTVVIEAGIYLFESKRWQSKLLGKVKGELEKLKSEVIDEVIPDQIENIRNENMKSITELYRELNKDVREDIKLSGLDDTKKVIEASKIALNDVNELLDMIGEMN